MSTVGVGSQISIVLLGGDGRFYLGPAWVSCRKHHVKSCQVLLDDYVPVCLRESVTLQDRPQSLVGRLEASQASELFKTPIS